MTQDVQTWVDYGEAFAFAGNSLLAPMNQTGAIGLDPEFWTAFPDFGSDQVRAAIEACEEYARDAQQYAGDGGDPVQRASVEYTALFIGPPRPQAAPWETMYAGGDQEVTVGFGRATFEMRELLREAGLEISNDNNQYADHIGIELLYASVLCTRVAEADGDEASQSELADKFRSFAQEHPLSWIDKLIAAVEASQPNGYFAAILCLSKALLTAALANLS